MTAETQEKIKFYETTKASFEKFLSKGNSIPKQMVSNQFCLIKNDINSTNKEISTACLQFLKYLLNICSSDIQCEVMKIISAEDENSKILRGLVIEKVVCGIQGESFNICEFLKPWNTHQIPKAVELFEDICGNYLDTATVKQFYLNILVPQLISLETENDVRNNILKIAFAVANILPISELSSTEKKDFLTSVTSKYIKNIGDLREKQYENWDQLWMFLVRYCSKSIHYSMDLTNKLLRVVEFAFRNQAYQQRLKGYDCWKELIDNAGLDEKYMSSDKQIKLLVTPLKAKFSKQDIVIIKRFEVFTYFMKKLQNNAVLVLTEFLEFCFGTVGETKDTNRTGQGKTVSALWPKSAQALLEILGSKEAILESGELCFSFQEPVIKVLDLHKYYKILINSVNECCMLINDTPMRQKIISLLWRHLFDLIIKCPNEITKNDSIEMVSNLLDNYHKQSKDLLPFANIMTDIFNTVFNLDTKLSCEVVKALPHFIFKFIFDLKGSKHTNYDKMSFKLALVESIKHQNVFNILMIYFETSKSSIININYACDTWMVAGVHIEAKNNSLREKYNFMSYLLWPIHFLHLMDEQTSRDVQDSWLSSYKSIFNNDESKKLAFLKEVHKLYQTNPLYAPNIVSILVDIINFEKNMSANIAVKFLDIVLSLTLLPTFKNIEEKTYKILIKALDPSKECFDDQLVIEKMCACIENILKLHKNLEVLYYFNEFIKVSRDFIKTSISKLLLSVLQESLTASTDPNYSNKLQSIIQALGVPKKEVKITNFISPVGRSAKIANLLAKNTPKTVETPSENSPTTFRLFGKNVDGISPLKVKGSQLNNTPVRSMKLVNSVKNSPKRRASPLTIDDESNSLFVPIDTEIKIQPEKLSEHQKEMMKKRREDIPALYQDLSQSQSQDIFSMKKNVVDEVQNKENTDENIMELTEKVEAEPVVEKTKKEDVKIQEEIIDSTQDMKMETDELEVNAIKKIDELVAENNFHDYYGKNEKNNEDGDKENVIESMDIDSTQDEDMEEKCVEVVKEMDQIPEKVEESIPEKAEEKIPEKTEEIIPVKTEDNIPEKDARKEKAIHIMDKEEKKRHKIENEMRRLKMDIVAPDQFLLATPRRKRSEKPAETTPKTRKSLNVKEKLAGKSDLRRKSIGVVKELSPKRKKNIIEIKTDQSEEKSMEKPVEDTTEAKKVSPKINSEKNTAEIKLEDTVQIQVNTTIETSSEKPLEAEEAFGAKKISPIKRKPRKSTLDTSTENAEEKPLEKTVEKSLEKPVEEGTVRRKSRKSNLENSAEKPIQETISVEKVSPTTRKKSGKTTVEGTLEESVESRVDKTEEKPTEETNNVKKVSPTRRKPRKNSLGTPEVNKRISARRKKEEIKNTKPLVKELVVKNYIIDMDTSMEEVLAEKFLEKKEDNVIKETNDTVKVSNPNNTEEKEPEEILKTENTIHINKRKAGRPKKKDINTEDILAKALESPSTRGRPRKKKIIEDLPITRKLMKLPKVEEKLEEEREAEVPKNTYVDEETISQSQIEESLDISKIEDVVEPQVNNVIEHIDENNKRKREESEDLTEEDEDIIESSQESTINITLFSSPSKRRNSLTRQSSENEIKPVLDHILEEPISMTEKDEQLEENLIEETPLVENQSENLNVTQADSTATEEDISIAETVTQTETETCDSNLKGITTCLQVDLPVKPELTDSEKIMCGMDTMSFISVNFSQGDSTLKQISDEKTIENDTASMIPEEKTIENDTSGMISEEKTIENELELASCEENVPEVPKTPECAKISLPSSPVTVETPTKTSELLNDTLDISPIAQKTEEPCFISSKDNETEERTPKSERSSRLLNMVNVDSPVTSQRKIYKKVVGGITMSPSAARIKKLMSPYNFSKMNGGGDDGGNLLDYKEEDLLTFSREVPSPLALPKSSILKRKFSDPDEGISPCAKRKRVNFSYPTTTSKKVFIKEDNVKERPTLEAKVLFNQNPSDKDLLDEFSFEFQNDIDGVPIGTEESIEVANPCSINTIKTIYPKLIDCTDDVAVILKKVTSPMFLSALTNKLKEKNIKTIGDLARQSEAEINRLPFKVPAVSNVYKALKEFYRNLNNEKHVTAETEIIQSIGVIRKEVDTTSEKDVEEEVVEECSQVVVKKDIREEFLDILERSKSEHKLKDFARIIINTMEKPEVLTILLKKFEINDILFEKDFLSAIQHIISQKGFSFVTEILKNSAIYSSEYQLMINNEIENKSLSSLVETRSLTEISICINNMILNQSFNKNEVLDICLIPLLDNPKDITSFFSKLTFVEISDMIFDNFNKHDFVKYFYENNENDILKIVNKKKVFETFNSEEITQEICKGSSKDIVNLIEKVVDSFNLSQRDQLLVDLFKTVSSKLKPKKMIQLHIEFLQNLDLSE